MMKPLKLPLPVGTYMKLPISLKLLAWRTEKSDLPGYKKWLNGKAATVGVTASNVWFQDYTGIPEINTLAGQRAALQKLGKDPTQVSAQVLSWMVIDHSAATWTNDLDENVKREFRLNKDRYGLAKWADRHLGIKVIPPGKGVIHQVNTEKLVLPFDETGRPNLGKGTDSHSPMVNCLGYIGWGVGGPEALQALSGTPIEMAIPKVYGVRLTGTLPVGVNASDLALYLKKALRDVDVTKSFVEIFGPGVDNLSLPSRATVANVAAEFGSRVAMFGIDRKTVDFLALSGRDDGVEDLAKAYGLWRDHANEEDVVRTKVVDVNLADIPIGIAGPDTPHNHVPLSDAQRHVRTVFKDKGVNSERSFKVNTSAGRVRVPNGALLLAAIASCTQTANPLAVLRGALFARNALRKGLSVKPWVKTAFAAGSPVAEEYLNELGLMEDLRQLGFNISAFGCGACIGQSGGLNVIGNQLLEQGMTGTSIASSNRNYAGRQDANVSISFLGRPDLVIAYAIAGRMDIDLESYNFARGLTIFGRELKFFGKRINFFRKKVSFSDLMPDDQEIGKAAGIVSADMYDEAYGNLYEGNDLWESIPVSDDPVYEWPVDSTTVAEPTAFAGITPEPEPIQAMKGGKTLFIAGDSFSTDAISPAGSPLGVPAAMEYLKSLGVTDPDDVLSIGGYRSNPNMLNRTIFSNPTNQNLMVKAPGGWTIHGPSGEEITVFAASERYRNEGTPLVVIGGENYGCGSSRAMAASGPKDLGVKVVIAQSFEAIHRSNLWQFGIVPFTFDQRETSEDSDEVVNAQFYGLDGTESWDIPLDKVTVDTREIEAKFTRANGEVVTLTLIVELESDQEHEFFLQGGAIPQQMRALAAA